MFSLNSIIDRYISFFEKRGHRKIPNSPLVPENDPTTLFTSSGMQPLVPYLLGETHPVGKRLVNAQNCFRAQDIDEVGDNRHTTFFRMLGNWSLGDPARNASASVAGGYFKKEQLPWFFEFLISKEEGLGLDPKRLYVTVFEGDREVPQDEESIKIWKDIFAKVGIDARLGERIFSYGVGKNWWSRAGEPDKMPAGEPGGPDSEVFYQFDIPHNPKFGKECHPNCQCGRFLEIGNSVFMEFVKTESGFAKLTQKNVDFGGGAERLLAAVEDQPDLFQTSLFNSIVQTIERQTGKDYRKHQQSMRIIIDHFVAAIYISGSSVDPSNKEQGYVLRRLIRRAFDHWNQLSGKDVTPVLEAIISQYKDTDVVLEEKFEHTKGVVLEESNKYGKTMHEAKRFLHKKYGGELKGVTEISADDAFLLYTTHGLSPTQIKSLGYTFDEQRFAEKMKQHQRLSRSGAGKKFAGGLADHSTQTIKGHTTTHLLHQALRDVLGNQVHQTGSNITAERIRFDFAHDRKMTEEEIEKVEEFVNRKIKENLSVHFEFMPVARAKKIGAIGLFDEKYGEKVKVYFIGDYSKEFCGGPHVEKTGQLKNFQIIKEESLGKTQRRIYAKIT